VTFSSTRQAARFIGKSGGSTHFGRVAEIDWIEAAGVYANLLPGENQQTYRSQLEKRLGQSL
jgi:two-component system, LytTR family, response regulator